MMIAMTIGAERPQTIAYGTVVVVRVIVAAAKRLAWLTALGEMSVDDGRDGEMLRRSEIADAAIIAPTMDAESGPPFLARQLVCNVGKSRDAMRRSTRRTQSIRLLQARSRR